MNEQITVLPNRCTFPELVGKEYPYLFNNTDEQLNMLRQLIQNNIKKYNYKTKNKLTLKNHSQTIDKLFTKLCSSKKTYFDKIKKQKNKS